MGLAQLSHVTRVEALERLHAQAQHDTAVLREQLASAMEREERLANEVQEARERALRLSPPPEINVSESVWRTAARELEFFTADELAAEVGATKKEALKHIRAYAAGGVLKHEGPRAWSFVKPTEAGAQFTAQQRLRVVAESPEQIAAKTVVRDHDIKQSSIGMVADKQIKAVCREAISNGWRLWSTGTGGHHLRLSKGDTTITVVSTPRNSGASAGMLRQKLGLR